MLSRSRCKRQPARFYLDSPVSRLSAALQVVSRIASPFGKIGDERFLPNIERLIVLANA
jgi:hypothetical protein